MFKYLIINRKKKIKSKNMCNFIKVIKTNKIMNLNNKTILIKLNKKQMLKLIRQILKDGIIKKFSHKWKIV